MNINTNPKKPALDSCDELQDVEAVSEKEQNPDDPVQNRNDFDDDDKDEGEPTTPKSECPAWPPQACELAKGDKVKV